MGSLDPSDYSTESYSTKDFFIEGALRKEAQPGVQNLFSEFNTRHSVPDHAAWARKLFNEIRSDGGKWMIPRSGIIIERREEKMAVVEIDFTQLDTTATAWEGFSPEEIVADEIESIRFIFAFAGIEVVVDNPRIRRH